MGRCAQGSFFEDHIYWLTHEQGLANGYPDFTFRPDNSITRAQMAFWLGNYNDRFDLADGITFAAGGEQSLTATASCPPGRRALGGGGKLSSNDLSVTDSFPNGSTTEWTVRVESDDNASISSGVSLTPPALCGPAPVPVTP